MRRSGGRPAELAGARTLAHRLALFAKQDRARSPGVHPDQAVDDERQDLVQVERRRENVRYLEKRGDLAQLSVRLALEPALLDDPRDLVGDRLQEVDLLASEIARLDR